MSKWVDYSFARPSIPQMVRDGISGVLRYIAPDTAATHGKILFNPERDALLQAGIDIALNFEWYEGRCNEGYQAGVQDGQTAVSVAKAMNYPQGKVIYFSHDTGVYNYPNIEAYFKGVQAAMGGYYRVGAYGSFDLIGHLHKMGLIVEGWQTLAWSNGQRDPWAEIYQDGTQLYGGGADEDIVTSTDIGSWKDAAPVVKKGFLMALTDAQQLEMYNREMATSPSGNSVLQIQTVVGRIQADTNDLQVQVADVKTVEADLLTRVASLQSAIQTLTGLVEGLGGGVATSNTTAKEIVAEIGSALVKAEAEAA